MNVRPATSADHDDIWRIVEPMLRAGETYALPRDWSREQALAYWFSPAHEVFVAETDGAVAGTYFIQANQLGGGSHVSNCGYVTDSATTGRGVARAMCEHSLGHARTRGFRAMQFNFVISTNERAVKLWQSFGFQIVGRLPGVFHHPKLGFVDALVMHLTLQ
ncbi:MAG: N-acetyltransferase [Myxococcaceae bacterium]